MSQPHASRSVYRPPSSPRPYRKALVALVAVAALGACSYDLYWDLGACPGASATDGGPCDCFGDGGADYKACEALADAGDAGG